MPSPKSGTAGSLVKPTAPDDAKEADDAVAGSTQSAANSGSKSGSSGSSVKVQNESPPPEHKPDKNSDKKSWIELQLVYESNGLPVAGMAYEVTLPDGQTVASGSTDEKGWARVDSIDPGSCQISFPTLDKEAWEDA